MAASAGTKRKSMNGVPELKSKKAKVERASTKTSTKAAPRRELPVSTKKSSQKTRKEESEDLVESDTSENENGFYGFAAKGDEAASSSDVAMESDINGSSQSDEDVKGAKDVKKSKTQNNQASDEAIHPTRLQSLNASNSREAHQKQKQLAKERKAAKPNADDIARSKKLWERLRLKSHVDPKERTKLVDELFSIITGRVKDFVFKHDSVRVIQCALKYASLEKRRMIARELKGEYKALAESKYAKFLIAKLLEKGDAEIEEMIISEFYGHVRRLINHPEASWILDDTYRVKASSAQKANLLREWYGPEFAIAGLRNESKQTADLAEILEDAPEKRKPILKYLENLTNQLIQKDLTGFTMLHDAMLQYFLALKPGSEEFTTFMDNLKPNTVVKEGEEPENMDLLKNLAFTASGSRLVSLAIAHGSAKDRKLLLRPYKDNIEIMAVDKFAHRVLLAALALVDDTRLTSKSIYGELFPSNSPDPSKVPQKILDFSAHLYARTILLYPFAADTKWLLSETNTLSLLSELYDIRKTTSKKDPNVRLQELVKAIAPQLLDGIAARAQDFAASAFGGFQFMTEVVLGAPTTETERRAKALEAIAELAEGDPSTSSTSDDGTTVNLHIGNSDQGRKMLKTLVQGGQFDPKSKKIIPVDPALGFADLFWKKVKDHVIEWATGPGSFVIVGLVESEDFGRKDEVLKVLKKSKKQLEVAAGPTEKAAAAKDNKKKKAKSGKEEKPNKPRGNAGARILLEKLR